MFQNLSKDRNEYLWLLNLKVLMYKKEVCKCTGAAENPFLNSVYRGEILDLGFKHNAISSLFKHNEIYHLNKYKKNATFFHLCEISWFCVIKALLNVTFSAGKNKLGYCNKPSNRREFGFVCDKMVSYLHTVGCQVRLPKCSNNVR